MFVNIDAENEALLKSIIENENWTETPIENELFKVLEDIKDNSEIEYKVYAENLINQLKRNDYNHIKEYIDYLIKNQE